MSYHGTALGDSLLSPFFPGYLGEGEGKRLGEKGEVKERNFLEWLGHVFSSKEGAEVNPGEDWVSLTSAENLCAKFSLKL